MQKLLSLVNPNYKNLFSKERVGFETQTTDFF